MLLHFATASLKYMDDPQKRLYIYAQQNPIDIENGSVPGSRA